MSTEIWIPPWHQIVEIYLANHNDRIYHSESFDQQNKPTAGISDDVITCANPSCNLHDIKETFMMLTDDQRKFVMHVYCQYKKNIKQNNNNPKIILLGPAGCGKTTIINFINKLITWDGNKTSDSPVKTKVLTCAYTRKSAERIEGFTLNSLLSKITLRETRRVNEKIIDAKKNIRENCIFFICDEITMVGKSLMERVNERLQQLFEYDKLYGNRFVLLVGDLYQPPPVGDQLLYPTSELWTCCEFFELTKIIRQKDKKFMKALNNFKNCEMTEEDITLLRSREIQNIKEVPASVIHIFYLTKSVYYYNIEKLIKSHEKSEIVRSLNETDKRKPLDLSVKIGIRYMITENLDVSDGLKNGTIGVVKGLDRNKNGRVDVIWMDFNSTKIGTKTRSDYLSKLNKPVGEKFPWVPIQQSKIIYKLMSTETQPATYHEGDNIFPLTLAEAITIHRSQGQTYPDGICIHITDKKDDKLRTDRTLQYLALTRVQKLDDLYIIGNLDFSTKRNKNLTGTQIELNRLRTECKLTLSFETFEDKTDDVIIFLNTGLTFNEHYEFIATDTWYGNGSLLIFIETNTIDSDKVKIPNFKIAFHSDTNNKLKSCGGIICYKKASKSVEVVDAMSNDASKMYLTLFLYEKYLYILTGNKGDMNDIDFINVIIQFINQYVKDGSCIFFIGTLDPKLRSNLTQFLNDEKFGLKLSCNASDKYDMIITQNFNINQKQCGFYEYIPSAHKPIYVKLPPKPDLAIVDDEPEPRKQDNVNELSVGTIQPTNTENELNRRGTKRKLSPAFETFEGETDDVIIFLNTGSTFNEHFELITTVSWYGNGSLLIFTETNTIGLDEIVIPNFEIAYRSDTKTALRSARGIICYKKASKSVEVINAVDDDDLTLLLYEKYLYIITGVKDDLKDSHFKNAIYHLIHAYVKDAECILLIGSLGPNLSPSLIEFFEKETIRIKLSFEAPDPNQEVTRHDMILTRNFDISLAKFGFYEHVSSANKPVYIKVSSKPALTKTEVGSLDHETPGTSRQCEEIIEILD